ncbi:hypothetical protein [Micromonospora sp. DT233]|uniref:hypothetical protein n=1 Tax=Micromonospora sp. DT233 TaxID=3393432 RepID=UPI003CE706A8
MTANQLVLKYCGVKIDDQALDNVLYADTSRPTVASELRGVLAALISTEAQIAALLPTISQSLRDVERVLTASPGDRTPPIDSTGVVQARGPRLDALLGRRSAQIEHLRAMTRLWATHHATPPTTSPARR